MTAAELFKTIAVALVAAGVAYGATPLAGRLAGILKMVDRPSARKIHGSAIPYLGGLGILAGWCVAFLTPGTAFESILLLAGMLVLGVTGFIDDRFDISERLRLGIQVAVAAAAYAGGIRMTPLDNVVGIDFWLFDFGLTTLWLVGITNAFNFMDNMDGLAAGTGAIAAAALGGVGMLFGQQLVSLLGFGLAGACLGFLRHNAHPARIFMGDTGSLPLGFGLAVLAIKVEFPGAHPLVAFSVPLIILGLFVIDTSVMVLGRILRDEPVIGARLDHLSHRLLRRKMQVRSVALRLYGAAGLLAIAGMITAILPTGWAIVTAVLVIASYGFVVLTAVRWPTLTVTNETQVDGDFEATAA